MNTIVKKINTFLRLLRSLWTKSQTRLSKISISDYTLFSIYAVFTGALVGVAAVLFHKSIHFVTNFFFENKFISNDSLGFWIILCMPAIGMFIQSMMIKLSPATAEKRGVSEVIKAVAMRGGFIRLRTTVFHFIAPVICIGTGGTVGPEGPAAQLGGGVASKFGQVLSLSDSRRRIFTAAGAGAAIAAVFNTPLGGIFFALEIILLNDFQSATFSALILASVTASAISRIFIGNVSIFIFDTPSIGSYTQLHLYAILGIAAGFLSLIFIRYSNILDRFFTKKVLQSIPQWMVMVSIGLLVGISGYFYKDILGIGYAAINHILANAISWKIVLILLVLKFILVPLILYSGGFGGLFAPSLFMGACFGYLYAFALNYFWGINVDTTTYVLVGMGAVLGGINSIPITAIMIIFEMTKNYSFILPLMLAVVISTMIVQLVIRGSVHIKHLEEQGFHIHAGREASILQSIRVNEVMREDIVLIPEQTPLPVLISQLIESPHGTFYTIDKNGLLVGAISETELRPIITEYENLHKMLVASDIARHEVHIVRDNEDLDHVLKMFGRTNLDEFPVISSSDPKTIKGTIWRQDVIAAYDRESLKFNLVDGLAQEIKSIKKFYAANVAEGYSIVERPVHTKFIGKTLAQLRIRNKYGLEVLMIRKKHSPFADETSKKELIIPDADYKLRKEDNLVLFGKDEKIEQFKL